MSLEQFICEHVDEEGEVCGREFLDPRALAIHTATHSRKKERCPKCGRTVSYLQTHLRKAHAADGEKLLEGLSDLVAEHRRFADENERLRKENIKLRAVIRHYEREN